MSNRVQFLRYDVGYQPTESLATQPPDKGSNVLPTLTTDLSRAYQELEEKELTIYKLSGLKLDDIVERLAAGFTLVPPDKSNMSLANLAKAPTIADRIRATSDDKELAKLLRKLCLCHILSPKWETCRVSDCTSCWYTFLQQSLEEV